jgi:hypothetical protein
MSHILSLVLTAMFRSLLPMPDSFLESRAGLGVLAHDDGVPCLIEDLVVLSRDRRPATSTLRDMQLDATGGLGQVKLWALARQVAHAADAAVDAPTPPRRRGRLRFPGRWSPAPVHLRFRTLRVLELLTGRSYRVSSPDPRPVQAFPLGSATRCPLPTECRRMLG